MQTIIILCFVGVFGCGAAGVNDIGQTPQLNFEANVASDFRALANGTWTVFLATFAARTNCFGDVTLGTDPDLDSRALYDPNTASITVRVPGTPAFLQAALVHEWAHHVEFQCDDHDLLRPLILTSLGLPPDTEWRAGHEWEDTPSEQYAEAAVELVLGDHPLPTKIRANQDLVDLLDKWSKGE